MAKPIELFASLRAPELVPPGARILALLSGGADSICLLSGLVETIGPDRTGALHVNHGLRQAAYDDQRFCAELCAELGVAFHVVQAHVEEGLGNLEGLARDARYEAAEAICASHGYDLIATGHTASDQAETVIYRLASSPGRRALLGIPQRRGRVIRPLLGVDRQTTRAYCREAGLEWREDASNLDIAFARNRIRHEVLPALHEVHPAAERNIVATAAELRDEAELLDLTVDQALEQIGAGGMPPAVEAAGLAALPAPLRRLVLRRLAERAGGGAVPLADDDVRQLDRLAGEAGSAYLDLGGGVRAACEYGVIRFLLIGDQQLGEAIGLPVPGSVRFGGWRISCELAAEPQAALAAAAVPDEAVLDASKLDRELEVRGWIDGDRISPLGLGGSKSLQDLFTDRKIPRALRKQLPVVVSGEQIAWIAGVAVSEAFKIEPHSERAVRLRAHATT